MIQVNPKVTYTVGGVTHNIYTCAQGQGLPRHEHDYGHMTVCLAGSLIIRKQNIERTITVEDGAFWLKPKEWHELEAAENGTVFENSFLTSEIK